jgi:hypothetical protein
MKTYVITLSKVFPATHPLKGEPTDFREAFQKTKLHTIRANYPLWAKRIAEVQRGEAVLSVRQWSGRPYMSKQETIATLTADDGVGIQKLTFFAGRIIYPTVGKYQPSVKEIANNDGLHADDWVDWFKNYDLSKPLAIIHFTKFRY